MKLVSFCLDGRQSCGYLEDPDTVVDLGAAGTTLASLLADHPDLVSTSNLAGTRVSTRELRWMPPVASSNKILCMGFNFPTHSTELAAPVPAPNQPTLFARFADSFVGHEQPIVCPTVSRELDWEGELAVVIGRRAWQVPASRALSFVAGYTCIAENSVRDWQSHGTQATAGKNFWRSGSLGPVVITADEIGEPSGLRLETRLNGDVMQSASLADMVVSVAEVIAYVTTFTPLAHGDVIAMGTPAGIGLRCEPPTFLTPGDTLEVEIDGIGLLRNPVAALESEQVS